MSNYIIYHNRCSDGMSAAFIAKLYHDLYGIPVEFIGINPNCKPSIEIDDDTVITMIDVTISREDLLDWKKRVFSLIVLDHHESGFKLLKDLKFCKFDMNKCGTTLAWEYFFGDQPQPWWVSYTEDRDLGRIFTQPEKCLPFSKEVNAYLINIPLTLEDYDRELGTITFEQAKLVGEHILKAQNAQIEWIKKCAGKTKFKIPNSIQYDNVPIINSSILQSELANILAKESEHGFAICWYLRNDDVYGPMAQVSLRSIDNINVASMAELFQGPNGSYGGGHPNASGFTVQFSKWLEIVNLTEKTNG